MSPLDLKYLFRLGTSFNRLDPRQTLIVFCYKLFLRAALLGCMCSFLPSTVLAQEPGISSGETLKQPAPGNEELSLAPAKVNVKPVNRDEEILKRLQNVLDATEWFIDPKVRVEEGVVFLSGQTETPELKKWAGDLARYHSIAPLYRFWTAHPGIVRGGRDIGHTRNESVS